MNEEQEDKILSGMLAIACPESKVAVAFRLIKSATWGVALFVIGWQIYWLESSFFRQGGAPAQCAVGIYSASWIVAAYTLARGIDAVFSSGIESLRDKAKKKALEKSLGRAEPQQGGVNQ